MTMLAHGTHLSVVELLGVVTGAKNVSPAADAGPAP